MVGLLYFKNKQINLEKKIRFVVTRSGVGGGEPEARDLQCGDKQVLGM